QDGEQQQPTEENGLGVERDRPVVKRLQFDLGWGQRGVRHARRPSLAAPGRDGTPLAKPSRRPSGSRSSPVCEWCLVGWGRGFVEGETVRPQPSGETHAFGCRRLTRLVFGPAVEFGEAEPHGITLAVLDRMAFVAAPIIT